MINNSKEKNDFIFNWILKRKLAIGTCPTKIEDINVLKHHKIKNIYGNLTPAAAIHITRINPTATIAP